MRTILLVILTGAICSGCASVKMDAIVLEQPDCQATPVVARTDPLVASVMPSADVHVYALPFNSSPPSAEDIKEHGKTMLIKSGNASRAKNIYDYLINLVPENDGLVNRSSSSAEAATAARDLHIALSRFVPQAADADRMVRAALAAGTAGGDISKKVTVATISAADDLNRGASRAIQAGGDDTLVLYSTAEFAVRLAELESVDVRTFDTAKLQQAAADYGAARFIRTYLKAYFRGGRIFQGVLKTDEFASAALKAIKAQLKVDDESALKNKLNEIASQVCKAGSGGECFLLSLGNEKLITRSGESLQFKGISMSVGYDSNIQSKLEYPKSVEFAPQLVRVLMEAVFDSMQGRPVAIAEATACGTSPPLFMTDECLSPETIAKYPAYQKTVAAADEKASRADSMASIVAGGIIRGVSIGALNNETVAKGVENLAGVLARKIVERAAWQQSGGSCQSSSPAVMINVGKD